MNIDEKLSRNFKLRELLHSDKADELGYTEQYTPSDDIIINLKELVDNVTQPARDLYGDWIRVSSGYRCPRVNTAVGSKPNSQHLSGEANDLVCADNAKLFELIKNSNIPFDQLIDENNLEWVHVSYTTKHPPRRQVLYL